MVYAVTRIIGLLLVGLITFLGLIQVAGCAYFAFVAFHHTHNPFWPWAGEGHAQNWALLTAGLLLVLFILFAVAVWWLSDAFEASVKAIKKASNTLDALPTLA